MTALERTIYPQLPVAPDSKWLELYATPTEAELDFVRQHSSDEKPPLQLGLMLLLKLFQCLHYFPDLETLPPRFIQRIRIRMDFDPSVTPTYDVPKTLSRHRGLILQYFRATAYHSRETDPQIRAILEDAAQRVNDPADLLNIVIESLVTRHQELPAFSTLDELTSQVRRQVHQTLFRTIEARLTPTDTKRLTALLDSHGPAQLSEWNLIKQPTGKASVSHMRDLMRQWEAIRAIVPAEQLLVDLLPSKIVHFAAEASVLNAKRLREADGTYTLLLCFLHQTQMTIRDDLARMFLERWHRIDKTAEKKLDDIQKKQRSLSEDLVDVLAQIVQAAESTEDNAQLGQHVRYLLDLAGGLDHLQIECETIAAHAQNDYFPLLYPIYQSYRSLLFELIQALDLHSTTHDTTLTEALTFMLQRRRQTRPWWEGTLDLSFTTQRWRHHIVGTFKGRPALNRRMLEPCVFASIADDLLSGDLYVPHSQEFGDIRDQFLSWPDCLNLLRDYCTRLGFPSTAAEFRRSLQEELTELAQAVDQGYPTNEYLVIDSNGKVTLKRLPRHLVPAGATEIHTLVTQRMPERHVLDILHTIHQQTNWSRHWGPRSGLARKLRDPLTAYLVTTFGYGCNLGPAQTARHTRDANLEDTLLFVNYQHVTPAKLEAAIRDVVNLFDQFELPRFWGTGKSAAADGTPVEMYLNNLIAQYHARYHLRGGIAFHYVSDRYVALFSQFITCGVWEGVYILDILQHNLSTIQPTTLHADTHGQSTLIFALAYLLGIELMPRIQSWQDLILFRPVPHLKYQHIDALFGDPIDWALIEKHWQDMIQVALSIQQNRLLPSTLLRKLGYRSRKNRLYQAFQELGRVIRTRFLLRYISIPPMRRQILDSTQKVELYHEFWQWLRFGSEGIINHNAPEEHLKRIRYTDLVANAVMVQNVADMTAIFQQLMREGYTITPEILATFDPYSREHIKRFGFYVIDFSTPTHPLSSGPLGIPLPSLN